MNNTGPCHNPENSSESAAASAGLESLRKRIDELDRALVDLLSRRARVVVEVGQLKRSGDTPIYAPHREQEVLQRILEMNEGPLSGRTLEAIYRELMSGSFSLELPLRIGYLGPAGSFSHVAATRQFGSSVEQLDLHEIEGVFEEVAKGRCHYGLVPYENSIGGGITDTLDAFQQYDVTIYAEALVDIDQTLLANCPAGDVKRIYSKPQVFVQCKRWLGHQYPDAEQIPMASTAASVRHAAGEPNAAAIGSILAGEIYDVKPLFESIQDKPNNITRFLVIGTQTAKPTGDDKTSIMFVTAHKPGALVDVLGVFRDADINLSHIEKRPSGRTNWEYTFFIDCDRHRDDPAMAKAIEDARAHCVSLKVLGSYPRAERVL